MNKINQGYYTGERALYMSKDVEIKNTVFEDGESHLKESRNLKLDNCVFRWKYPLWNCENVVVYDSKIIGEYLAWNTKNITFINCTIESEQGLCYIDGLTMKNCNAFNTSLALEYVEDANVEITSHIDSIKNPISGVIKVKSVGELIADEAIIDPSKTQIIVEESSL